MPSVLCRGAAVALASLLLAVCCLCAVPTSAAHGFDAYRLVQYDRGARAMGSRRTAINMQATVQTMADEQATASDEEWTAESALNADDEIVEASTPKSAAADLQRKVVVVPIASLTPAKLRTLLRVRLASGLLIVLPRDLSSVDGATLARFRLLEKFLAQRSWEVAIYFAFDDDYLQTMVANLRATIEGGAADNNDRYHLQVTTPDATLLTGATVNNLHVRATHMHTTTRTRAHAPHSAARGHAHLSFVSSLHPAVLLSLGLATRCRFVYR